jgi:hypothetical protein
MYVTFSNRYVVIYEFHFTYQLALISDSSIFPTRIDMRRIPVLFKDALSSPD